jgi:thioredoxin-like negative regulator of GroEL
MNTVSRREKIEAMLANDPADNMLRYMLAMELDKSAEHDRSLELFASLMADSPPHVPAFLMAGQQLVKLDRIEAARTTLRDGIEAARTQGNSHAAGEMAEFLAQLGSEG